MDWLRRLWTRQDASKIVSRDPAAEWRATVRKRLRVTTVALLLWVAGIESRLLYLQVVAQSDLVARAERQHSRTIDAPAKRGDIFDRGGRVLATSADADTIYAVPSEIQDPQDAVAK